MKKSVLFTTLILTVTASVVLSCTSDHNAQAEERKIEYAEYIDNPTEITFEEDSYDFGVVTEGEKVRHTYKFTNTGDQTLVLINVTGSCGCTVPEDWPKQPIPPGETGEIKVVFDSEGRAGNVRKNVRVEANINPSPQSVELTGVVKAR